ncbi:MAG: T9SS type A sorting domain-containing protein [Fluviicola sp.]
MKSLKQILLFSILATANASFSQYTHPTVGIQGEFVGSCLVADCGPSTYTDNGGVFGNYSNGINQIYRVFCPSIAGNCMQVTFTSFNVEPGWDFLIVKNGPTQNSPDILTPPNSPTVYGGISGLHGNLATPFGFTSTDPSGCLTFRFYSDGSVSAPGWVATLSCVPCAGGPTGTENNDCNTFTPICSSASISSNATGPGIVAEGCTGSNCPAGGENHTNWYSFTAQTSGTLDILINPDDNNDDYDYAIYGPNVTCAALGNPIRCSDAAVTGNTGLTNVTPNENTEDVTGDGFTETMNVIAGESYFLVVDEWSPNAGSGYTLSFGGTASLDCSILPVELREFNANYEPEFHAVTLDWITDSERNCDYFDVERSTDGVNFEVIEKVKGAGTTNQETQYFMADTDPELGVNYYRLNQWDEDGNGHYSDVVSVNILDDQYDILSLFPNPTTGMTEVIFNSYKKEEVMLNVVGLDGKVIVNTPLSTVPGGNRFNLDLSGHNHGVYFVTITSGEKSYHSKLIKN